MKIKRIISFFLIISIACLPILSACGGKSDNGNSSNTTSAGDAQDTAPASTTDPKEQYDPKLAAVDMQGYVFTIGTRDDSTHNYPAHTRDLYAEQENGDLINDAVYKRNTAIEDKYNCTIKMQSYNETTDETAANKVVAKSVKAGDYSFDLLMTHMIDGANDAANGNFYDLEQFPNVDLSKPYWNQGATYGCSIGNKLLEGLSDLSFSSNENVYCMFFNKQLLQNYGVENPYQLVKDNQWTFDKFNDIIKVGTADLNGDGIMDKNDQYGYISSCAMNFLWAGGSHIMTKDTGDIPALDFNTQQTVNIFNKAYDITNNEYTFAVEEWFQDPAIQMFSNGQGVFYSSQLCRVNDLRAVNFDFGIVPYPKYDSSQDRYYSYVDGHASMMAIPLCLPHPEWTGMIIEDMSYLAYKDILPTYYDVVLNVKMVRDQESVDMLQILFDSKTIDPGYVWGSWDFWYIFIDCIFKKQNDFVSAYEKKEKASMTAIQKKIDAVLALQ
ncbi:MAG: hypothetical protein FWD71_06115 [Oscillospiraceae bacterium]|nr:hypothetical protein [Oscillospiraceae bacterium]